MVGLIRTTFWQFPSYTLAKHPCILTSPVLKCFLSTRTCQPPSERLKVKSPKLSKNLSTRPRTPYCGHSTHLSIMMPKLFSRLSLFLVNNFLLGDNSNGEYRNENELRIRETNTVYMFHQNLTQKRSYTHVSGFIKSKR